MILVTGGAGFIGSNFILDWIEGGGCPVVNLDKLTYAGNLDNLRNLEGMGDYSFIQGDICNRKTIGELLYHYRPKAIVNFAAESHVDRSISGPSDFINTNILGTYNLLDVAREFFEQLSSSEKEAFRFLHVSTDEVYGSLEPDEVSFSEKTAYAPNSPYSATKASSDHLVRAWHETYGLPTLITNCSNNYGPFQFPEKLVPLVIVNALAGADLPIYGDGLQIRDWLYVQDHCRAIARVLEHGRTGECYNVGGNAERTNLEVVRAICSTLDKLCPHKDALRYDSLIRFVKDRPGHDRRYSVDASKLKNELGWVPNESLESGLEKTVTWYLENMNWVERAKSGAYRDWIKSHYAAKLD